MDPKDRNFLVECFKDMKNELQEVKSKLATTETNIGEKLSVAVHGVKENRAAIAEHSTTIDEHSEDLAENKAEMSKMKTRLAILESSLHEARRINSKR